ncbi:MAG: oligopeptide transporter, OPT family [Selenomonadaceae bacterium]|nr:oligopeptide transporter, OPT family [Selenomonadaceae bacterium]
MEKETFKPYIPAEQSPLELTKVSIIVGVLLAVVFGAANAYLGLRVGMTISASIPAAVISMAVIRVLLRRDSILENNMVQTIGSAGESIAAGCIFTLPAIFMWSKEWGAEVPSIAEIALIAFIGGCLGVFFMVPLRKALIVKEHGVLPYPEGTACAEILLAGEDKGSSAKTIFAGLGIAAVYKFIADGLKIFPSEIAYTVERFKGSEIGMDVLPALLGVGYICGYRVAATMFAGGLIMWFCILPCIAFYGVNETVFPAAKAIGEMVPAALWSSYGRYIGAGALATGGIISLLKSLPLIIDTFKKSIKSFSSAAGVLRTDTDLSMKVLIPGIIVMIVLMVAAPIIPINALGAVLVVIFGFFFATVSSRIVGIVGSSNNPVSGMTIASLLFISIIFVMNGQADHAAMIAIIAIGSIICVVAALSGDTSQDLKTGYILGATPVKQQIGEIIGVVASALTVGCVLYLLDAAWGYGSKELAAPQATLMKMIVEGVITANLPWDLIMMGAALAVAVEILGIPVLAFAIGLYLPIYLTAPLFVGGVIRAFYENKKKFASEEAKTGALNNGILLGSGMIAGEGIVGIILAVLAALNIDTDMSGVLDLGQLGGLAAFILLVVVMIRYIEAGKKNV